MLLKASVFGFCNGKYGSLPEWVGAKGISVSQICRVRDSKHKIHKGLALTIALILVLLAVPFTGFFKHTAEAGGAVSVTRNFSPTADTYVHGTNTTYNYGVTTFMVT